MKDKNDLISITEMAKLRAVTTETLRHYDRIGLLKPDFTDDHHMRYYSVLKYELLETIRELQQTGLSLKEIQTYLQNRNVESSRKLLLQQLKYCEEEVSLYQTMEKKIKYKVEMLEKFHDQRSRADSVKIVTLKKRTCLLSDLSVRDEESLARGCMDLENRFRKYDPYLPIYASNNYAGSFPMDATDHSETGLMLLFDHRPSKLPPVSREIPEGDYLTTFSNESFWDRRTACDKLTSYAREHHLNLDSTAIIISRIDYSITDLPEERLYEYQVRILQSD